MNKKFFAMFLNFLRNCRRGGTSSLIKKIAHDHDVYIIVATEKDKDYFPGLNTMSLTEIKQKAHGLKWRPILIDNHALLQICEGAIGRFGEMESEIAKKEEIINNIRDLIGNR